jgi:hypothetical protein
MSLLVEYRRRLSIIIVDDVHRITKLERTLLADIEATGLPLDQISLVDLCDDKEGIYGAPGAPRWPVQVRFAKIKQLTITGYRRLLAKHNIIAGPATLAAQAAARQDTDKESEDDEEEQLSDNEKEEVSNNKEESEDEQDSNIDTLKLTRARISSPINSKSASKMAKTPPRDKTPSTKKVSTEMNYLNKTVVDKIKDNQIKSNYN